MRTIFVLALITATACSCAPTEVKRKEELRAAAETAVRKKLRDPESAMFSEVDVRLENGSVCGRVNAKNGFGGYVGNEHFAFFQGNAAVGSEDPSLLPLMKKCTEASKIAADNAFNSVPEGAGKEKLRAWSAKYDR